MPESAFLPEPFTVQASPEALADLRARLFAPLEEPEFYAAELRAFFRPYRA
jgi:hypothetical protein